MPPPPGSGFGWAITLVEKLSNAMNVIATKYWILVFICNWFIGF
jgi:hypothetical protein